MQILGIEFFNGTAKEAVDKMSHGGLLVVPAAPALRALEEDRAYREALLHADMAITDSAFMVMVWNQVTGEQVRRLSGLEYLRELLAREETRRAGNTFWIMASQASAERNLLWLAKQGINPRKDCLYMAPMYTRPAQDPELLALLEKLQPQNIIINIGGGSQEPLGLYLKQHLSYRPAIHCTGAAIAFLSGDQVVIPRWADRFYLGWLFRSMSAPQRYVPRYWGARKLGSLIVKYRDQLPPLNTEMTNPQAVSPPPQPHCEPYARP